MKTLPGWNSNYDSIIESGKMETLEKRREMLTTKFAKKASENVRFGHWFREKDYGDLNLRHKSKYDEEYARTERMRNSPVFYMRRILNAN